MDVNVTVGVTVPVGSGGAGTGNNGYSDVSRNGSTASTTNNPASSSGVGSIGYGGAEKTIIEKIKSGEISWRSFASYFDNFSEDIKASEQDNLNKLIRSGKLQEAVEYSKGLQDKYGAYPSRDFTGFLSRKGFSQIGKDWVYCANKGTTMSFPQYRLKVSANTSVVAIPYGEGGYFVYSSKNITMLYGLTHGGTKMLSFHYTSGWMRLNEVHLWPSTRTIVNSLCTVSGVDMYDSYPVDISEY